MYGYPEWKKYFLDGTEEYIALNDYAQRIQGKQVLIEDGANHLLDRVPEFPADRNKVVLTRKLAIADNQITGNETAQYNGESKISVQGAYASIRNEKKSESLANFLSNSNRNVEVLNIATPDLQTGKNRFSLNST